ncbi:44afb924-fffb-4319-9450-53f16ea413db [Sclerotinia trifoliorum]|uniref:ATP-dependent RNA helicase n=1 Tax=Sclerotinia trifoliorum TaxID=28548 RepID=A0A8H2VPU5_9HELO|nr:44afb924-fffb-4319-9450-53f16ea413db [Sclerotinia trifoliorum]
MDILRLLSRSTKQSGQNGSYRVGGVATKLPSSGTSANPQLYHDPIPESRGKKRKRGGQSKDVDTTEQTDGNLDFFSSDPATQKTKKSASTNDAPKPAQSNPSSEPEPLLDEGECRQILKSHRLKVTLLPGAKPRKKIKKSKKSKSAKTTSSKEEIKQLYPQPLTAFEDLRATYKISGRLSENLKDQGYKIPTEVQMGSLPLLLKPSVALGSSSVDTDELSSTLDLLAVAPTGSGKTLAFLIPVINDIVQRRRTSDKNHVLEAVIIAPTKELASQIVNEGKKLSIGTGVKILGMKKGMKIVPSADAEEKEQLDDDEDDDESVDGAASSKQPLTKTDILVTTPLIFLNALSLGSIHDHAPLPTVRTLVFDEADVLLDPLFRDQTLGIWNSCINPNLRVTLWSATMGSNIETLASGTIQARQERLGLEKHSNLVRLVVGLKDSAIPNITHRLIYAATEPGKLIALRQLLRPTAKTTDGTEALRPPFLVFTQTIPRAIALHAELLYDIPAEAGGSTRIAVLHSDLSDSIRDQVMTRFRNGEIWILITTDILSRGVDFKGINGVVNYDVPNSGAAYIHRVGRTGRAGRDGGIAVTFYTKEDIPYVKNVANIIAASEKQAGKPASEASMQKWLLDALPTPSKEEKKKLKRYGVEARRGGLNNAKDGKDSKGGKSKSRMQISTKSGYERKLEHNRKGAIQGSKRREQEKVAEDDGETVVEDGWAGIED